MIFNYECQYPLYNFFFTCRLKNREIIMRVFSVEKESDVQKVRGVVRGVVSAAVFGTMLSLYGRRQIFIYSLCQSPPSDPRFLLFTFLSFTCSPFLLFLFRVQMNALP